MPAIDTLITEHSFISYLAMELEKVGWKKEAAFFKVAYEENVPVPLICASRHVIMRSPVGDLVGFAKTSDEFRYKGTSSIQGEGLARINPENRMPQFYLYSLEKLPTVTRQGFLVSTTSTVQRMALDVEHLGSGYESHVMQSPVIPIKVRKAAKDEKFFGGMSEQRYANWWDDSLIAVRGFIDDRSFFLTIQADNAMAWEKNAVPRIPLFFGRLTTLGPDDGGNVALFAGTYGESFDPSAQYPAIMPVKKHYFSDPGNGVNNVIVRKTKYGSRYQAHYLSWATAPNAMLPSEEGYPRDWRGRVDGHTFNPSTYSQDIIGSEAHVIHPEDGVYGIVPNVILISQLSILDLDILEVDLDKCYDGTTTLRADYIYHEISAPSPVTLSGSAIHRPAGVGILLNKKEV